MRRRSARIPLFYLLVKDSREIELAEDRVKAEREYRAEREAHLRRIVSTLPQDA